MGIIEKLGLQSVSIVYSTNYVHIIPDAQLSQGDGGEGVQVSTERGNLFHGRGAAHGGDTRGELCLQGCLIYLGSVI